jgi:hypothetical protein
MVKVIQDAHNIDVPVPEFVRNNQGFVLGQYTDPSGAGIYYWLTRFLIAQTLETRVWHDSAKRMIYMEQLY